MDAIIKRNSAYNTGGPEEAISLLNRNFDLDIKNYVSVNFNALVKVIDALGGIDIKIDEKKKHTGAICMVPRRQE